MFLYVHHAVRQSLLSSFDQYVLGKPPEARTTAVPQPYEPFGIWLIDQWRQIGVNVKHNAVETSAWFNALRNGDFEVASDAQCSFIVEPDVDLQKFQ